MAIIYDDLRMKSRGFNFTPEYWPQDDIAAKYAEHAYNWLYLHFIFQNSSNTLEKIQASNEMKIAERKMKYWYGYVEDTNILIKHINEVKNQWNYKKSDLIFR